MERSPFGAAGGARTLRPPRGEGTRLNHALPPTVLDAPTTSPSGSASDPTPWGTPTGLGAVAVFWAAVLAGAAVTGGVGDPGLWATAASAPLVVAAIHLWLRERYGGAAPAWGRPGIRRSDLLAGFAAGAVVLLLDDVGYLLLESAIGAPPAPPEWMVGGGAWWLELLAVAVAVPLVEEFVFRGVLFQGLRGRWGTRVAAGASSLAFGVGHAWSLDTWGLYPAVSATGFGLVMCWLLVRRGSLVPAITAHATVNATVVVLGIAAAGAGLAPSAAADAATCETVFVAADAVSEVQVRVHEGHPLATDGDAWRRFRTALTELEGLAAEGELSTAVAAWQEAADDAERGAGPGGTSELAPLFAGSMDLLSACAVAGHAPPERETR